MKPVREEVDAIRKDASFVAYALSLPHFEFRWHYHPECELTLITRGSGTRIVGDSHETFGPGDLVLLGPRLPHTWSSAPDEEGSSAIVIQFSEAFLAPFLALSEFEGVRRLLEDAQRGLHFDPVPDTLALRLQQLPDLPPALRVVELLSVLDQLPRENARVLASGRFLALRPADAQRINTVCHFIQEKAASGLTLSEVAALIHLSPSAFCKFFKRHTGRGFSDYVNDIRVAEACLQLVRTDKTIREVAADTGYDSLTYFNRIFRQKKEMTPSAFRKNAKSAV